MFSCSTRHSLGKFSKLIGVCWNRCRVTALPLLASVKHHREETCWNHSFGSFEVIRKFNKPELSSTICAKGKIQFHMRHRLGLVWFILYQQHFSDQFINTSLTWQAKQVSLNLKKENRVREKKKHQKNLQQKTNPVPSLGTCLGKGTTWTVCLGFQSCPLTTLHFKGW